jgi:hypothetical protein
MHDPKILWGQARRCRALMKTIIELEAIEQLRLWAAELAEEADDVERAANAGLAFDPRPGRRPPRCAREGRFPPHQHRNCSITLEVAHGPRPNSR